MTQGMSTTTVVIAVCDNDWNSDYIAIKSKDDSHYLYSST